MIKAGKHIWPQGSRKRSSFVKSILILCLALSFIGHNSLLAQVITNNGAAISVSTAVVVNSKDVVNTAGSIGNDGTINLSGDYNSTAATLGNGTFRIGGNWTNTGGIFTPGISTVIFNGVDNQAIIRNGGESFYNLSVENTGAPASKSISLLNNVTVTGTLLMHLGIVNTTTYKLLLSNPAAASLNYTSSTGSRILGKFERALNQAGTYLFPLGTSSYYNPANLITNNVPSPGTVLSEFKTSPAPGNAGLPLPDPPVEVFRTYVDGYWSLTSNGFSSGDFNINLNGTGFTDTIFDITRVVKRTGSGIWTVDGSHADASGSVVYRNNLSGNISSSGTQFALARVRPLITTHPVSQIVCEKTNPVFSVTATGTVPLTYIWYKDGVAIISGPHYSGNRTNTLTILNAVLSDAGTYYCVVRDRDRNSTTSNSATLTVNKIPVATATPSLQGNECSGIAFTDIVMGESYGVPGTTYIWSRTEPSGITTPVAVSGTAPTIGSILSGYFTNSTDDPIAITFTITPVGPNPTYCVGIPISAIVTVNPTPRVVPVNIKPEICYGTSTAIRLTTPTHFTQGVIKFDYTVSIASPPAVVAGNRASATDIEQNTVLSFPYTNESDNLQSVFFNITPKVVGLGCPTGVVVSPEVKVHPKTIQYNYAGTSGDGILITTPLTCEGGSDAALRVITANGAGPYRFDWVRTSQDQVHGYNIPDIVNRRGGRWNVTVTDNLGCANSSFQFVEGAFLDSYLYVVDTTGFGTTCPGSNDGQIWIKEKSSSTGIAPFEYWIVRNAQDTVIHDILPGTEITRKWSNLLPGNYKLFLKDFNGCYNISYPEASIIEPDIIKVEFDTDTLSGGYNVSCLGYSDSHIRIKTISGGNGGYTYQWFYDSGLSSPIPGQTADSISGLVAGKYYLRTTDRKSCMKIDSVIISQPDGMQLTASELSHSADGLTNISCSGGNDGYIKMTISGGSGNYLYSWTGPNGYSANTRDISGLKSGIYTCTVKDLNGCILTPSPSFTLTEPLALVITNLPSVSIDGAYNINCNGGTGSIDISVTGGSSTGIYKYTWSSSDGSGLIDGEDQPALATGTYNLVVTDSNGCNITTSATLTQPPSLLVELTAKDITCQPAGFNNGEVNLTVSGGVAPYLYSWSNGADTQDIAGLTEGNYKVTVTDVNGCSKTDSVRINLPPPLSYTKILSDYNTYNIKCFGLSDGFIQINPTSGVPPFIYSWSGPNGYSASTKDISDLAAGDYTLLITDSNECSITETITLTEPGKPGMTFSLSASNAGGFNINCAGDSTGSITVEPLNQVITTAYLWSDGSTDKARTNLPAGEYNVIITDANLCQTSSKVTLTEPDPMKLVLDVTKPLCPDKPDGEIRLNVTGGVPGTGYTYRWSDNSTGSNISNILKGFYKVIVKDMNDCTVKDSVNVEPKNETCLIVPNAISPNGDLINDVWNIGMIELYPEIEIKIFNRWGESVWKSAKGYPQPWDGKSNGHSLPIDSYHYIIDLHNGTKPLVGNVTIVR